MWRNAPAKAAIFLLCWLLTHRPAAVTANVVPTNVWYQNDAVKGGEILNDLRNQPLLDQLPNANSQMPPSLQPQADNNYHQPPPRNAQQVDRGRVETQDIQRAFNQQEARQLQQFPSTQNRVVNERVRNAGDDTHSTSTNRVETQNGQRYFNQQVAQIQQFPSNQNRVENERRLTGGDGTYSTSINPVDTQYGERAFNQQMGQYQQFPSTQNHVVNERSGIVGDGTYSTAMNPVETQDGQRAFNQQMGQLQPFLSTQNRVLNERSVAGGDGTYPISSNPVETQNGQQAFNQQMGQIQQFPSTQNRGVSERSSIVGVPTYSTSTNPVGTQNGQRAFNQPMGQFQPSPLTQNRVLNERSITGGTYPTSSNPVETQDGQRALNQQMGIFQQFPSTQNRVVNERSGIGGDGTYSTSTNPVEMQDGQRAFNQQVAQIQPFPSTQNHVVSERNGIAGDITYPTSTNPVETQNGQRVFNQQMGQFQQFPSTQNRLLNERSVTGGDGTYPTSSNPVETQDGQGAFNQQMGQFQQFPSTQNRSVNERSDTGTDSTYPTSTNPVETQNGQRAFNQQMGQFEQFPSTQNRLLNERSVTGGDGTYPTSSNPVETQNGQRPFNQQMGQIQQFPSTQNRVVSRRNGIAGDSTYPTSTNPVETQNGQGAFNQQVAQIQQFPSTQNRVVSERSGIAGDSTYPTSTNPAETQNGQRAFNQQMGQLQQFPIMQNPVPKERAVPVDNGIYSSIPVYTLPHDEKMQKVMTIVPHHNPLWNDAEYPAVSRTSLPILNIPPQQTSPWTNEGTYKTILGQSSPNHDEVFSSLRLPWGSERSNQLYVPFSNYKPNPDNYRSSTADQGPGKGVNGSPSNIRILNTFNSGDSSFFPRPEISKFENFFYNRNPSYVTPKIMTPSINSPAQSQNNPLQTNPQLQNGQMDNDLKDTALHPAAIIDVVGNTIYPDIPHSVLPSLFPIDNQNQINYNSSRTLDDHNQETNNQIISSPQFIMSNRNSQSPLNPTLIASPQPVMKEGIYRSRNNQVNILPLPRAFFTPRDISSVYSGDFGTLPVIQNGHSVIPLMNDDHLGSLSLHPISTSMHSFEGPYLTGGPISKDYEVIHPAYTGQFSMPAMENKAISPVGLVSIVKPLGSARESEYLIPQTISQRDGTFPGFIKSEATNNVHSEPHQAEVKIENSESALDSIGGNIKRFQQLPIFTIAGDRPLNFPQLPQGWASRNEVPYFPKASNMPYGSNFQVITSYLHRPPYNMGIVNVEHEAAPDDVERRDSKGINLGGQTYNPDDHSVFLNPMTVSRATLSQNSSQDEINNPAGLSIKPQYPQGDWQSDSLPAAIGGGRNIQMKDSESGIFSDYRLPFVRGDTNKKPTDENLELLYPGTHTTSNPKTTGVSNSAKQTSESLKPEWSADRINDNSYPKIQDLQNRSGDYHSDPTQNRNHLYPSIQNYGVVTEENIKSSSKNLIGETYENLHDTRTIGTDEQKTKFDTKGVMEDEDVEFPTGASQSLMDTQMRGDPQPDANPETVQSNTQQGFVRANKDTPPISRQYKIVENMAINSTHMGDFNDDQTYTDSQPQHYREPEAPTETIRSGSDSTVGSRHFNNQNSGQSVETVIDGVPQTLNFHPGQRTMNRRGNPSEVIDEKYREEQREDRVNPKMKDERMKDSTYIVPSQTFFKPSGSYLANQKPIPNPSELNPSIDDFYNTGANNQHESSSYPRTIYPENKLFAKNEVNIINAYGQRLFDTLAEDRTYRNLIDEQLASNNRLLEQPPIHDFERVSAVRWPQGERNTADEQLAPTMSKFDEPKESNETNIQDLSSRDQMQQHEKTRSVPSYNQRPYSTLKFPSNEGEYKLPTSYAENQRRSPDLYEKNQELGGYETPYNGQYNSPFKVNAKDLKQTRKPQFQKELIVNTTTDENQRRSIGGELRPFNNMAEINQDRQPSTMNAPLKQNSIGNQHPLSPLTDTEQRSQIADEKTKQYKITVHYPQQTDMAAEHNIMMLGTQDDEEEPAEDRTEQRKHDELYDASYNAKQSISAYTTGSDGMISWRKIDSNGFADSMRTTSTPSPYEVPLKFMSKDQNQGKITTDSSFYEQQSLQSKFKMPQFDSERMHGLEDHVPDVLNANRNMLQSPNILAGSNANTYKEVYGVNQSPYFPDQNTRYTFTGENSAGREDKKGVAQYTVTMYDTHQKPPSKTNSEVEHSEIMHIPGEYDRGGLTGSRNVSPSLFDDENIDEEDIGQHKRTEALRKQYNDGDSYRPYSTARSNRIDLKPQNVNNSFDKQINTTKFQGQYKVAVKFPSAESTEQVSGTKPQTQRESQLIIQGPTGQNIQPSSVMQPQTTDDEYSSTGGTKQYTKNIYDELHSINAARYLENTRLPVEHHHQRLAEDSNSATNNDEHEPSHVSDGSYPITSNDDGTKQYTIMPYDVNQKRPSKDSSTTEYQGNTDLFEEYDYEGTIRNMNIPPNTSDKSRISKYDGVNVKHDTKLSKGQVNNLEQPYNASHSQYIVAVKFISDGKNRRGSKLSQENIIRGNVDENVQASRTFDGKHLDSSRDSNREINNEDSTKQLLNYKEISPILLDQTNRIRPSPISSSEAYQVLLTDRGENKVQDDPDKNKSPTNNYGTEVEGEQLWIKSTLQPTPALNPKFELTDAAYYRGRYKAGSGVDPKSPNLANSAIHTDAQITEDPQNLSRISTHLEETNRVVSSSTGVSQTERSEDILKDNKKVLGNWVSGQRDLNDEEDTGINFSSKTPLQKKSKLQLPTLPSGDLPDSGVASNDASQTFPGETIPMNSNSFNTLKQSEVDRMKSDPYTAYQTAPDRSNIRTPDSKGPNAKNELTSSPEADRANWLSYTNNNDTTRQYRTTVNDETQIYSLKSPTEQYQQNMELPIEYGERLLTQHKSSTPYTSERLPTTAFRDDNDQSRQKELFLGQPYNTKPLKSSLTVRYQDNTGWPVDYGGSIGNGNEPSNGSRKLPTDVVGNPDVVYNANQANQKERAFKQQQMLPGYDSTYNTYRTDNYETKKEYKVTVYDNDGISPSKSTSARRFPARTEIPVEYEKSTSNKNISPNMSGRPHTDEYDNVNVMHGGNAINHDLLDDADRFRQGEPFLNQRHNENLSAPPSLPSSVGINPEPYAGDHDLVEDGDTMYERSSKLASTTPSTFSSTMVQKFINTRTINDQYKLDLMPNVMNQADNRYQDLKYQQRYMTSPSSDLSNSNNGETSTYPHHAFGEHEVAPDIRMRGTFNTKHQPTEEMPSSSEQPLQSSGQRFLESGFGPTKEIAHGRQLTNSLSEITSDNSLIYKYYGSEKPLNLQAHGVANSFQDKSKTSTSDPQLTQQSATQNSGVPRYHTLDNIDISNLKKAQNRPGRVHIETTYESPDDEIEFYPYLTQKGDKADSTSDLPNSERGYFKPNDGSYNTPPNNQLIISNYGGINKLSSRPYHEESERMTQLSNPLKSAFIKPHTDDAEESSEREKLTVDENDRNRSKLSNDKKNVSGENIRSRGDYADHEKLNNRGVLLNEELGNVNTFENYPHQSKSSLEYELNDRKIEPQSLPELIRKLINENKFISTTDSTNKYLGSTKMSTAQSSNHVSDPETQYLYNTDISTISKTQLPTNQRITDKNDDAKVQEEAIMIPDSISGYTTTEVTNDGENTKSSLQVGWDDRHSKGPTKDGQNLKNSIYKDDRQNFGSRNLNNGQEGSLENEKLQYSSKVLDKYSDQQYQDPSKIDHQIIKNASLPKLVHSYGQRQSANAEDQDKNQVTTDTNDSDVNNQRRGKPVSTAKTPMRSNGNGLLDSLMGGMDIDKENQPNEQIKPDDIWLSLLKGAIVSQQTLGSPTFKGSNSGSTSENPDGSQIYFDPDLLDNDSESYHNLNYSKFKAQPAIRFDHTPGNYILSHTDIENEGNQVGSPYLLSPNSTDTERSLISRLMSRSQTDTYGTPMNTLVEITTGRQVTNNRYTNGGEVASKALPMSQITSSPIVDLLMTAQIPVQRGYNNSLIENASAIDTTEANKFYNSEANHLANTEATKELNFDHSFLTRTTGVDHAKVTDQTSSTEMGITLTRMGWETVQESTSITSAEKQSLDQHYQDKLFERPGNAATTERGTKDRIANDYHLEGLTRSKPSDQGGAGSIKRGDNLHKYEESLHMNSSNTSKPDFMPPNSSSDQDILEDNTQGSIGDVTMTRTGWKLRQNSQQQLGADHHTPSLTRIDEPHKPSERSLLKDRNSGLPNKTTLEEDYTNQTNDAPLPPLNITRTNGEGNLLKETNPKVSSSPSVLQQESSKYITEQDDDSLGELQLKTQPISGQRGLSMGTGKGNKPQIESPSQNIDKLKIPPFSLEKQLNGGNVLNNETSNLPAANKINGDTHTEQPAHTKSNEVHKDCSPGTNLNPTVVVQIVNRTEKEVHPEVQVSSSPRTSLTRSSIETTEQNDIEVSGQRALGDDIGDPANLLMKSPSQNKDGLNALSTSSNLPNSKSENRPGKTIQKWSSSIGTLPGESTINVSEQNDEVPCNHSSKKPVYSSQRSLDETATPMNSPSQNMKLPLVTLDKPSTNSNVTARGSESPQEEKQQTVPGSTSTDPQRKSIDVLEAKDKILISVPSKTQASSGHDTPGERTDEGKNLPTSSVSQNTMVPTLTLDWPSHSSILTDAKSENGLGKTMQNMFGSSSTLKPENSVDVLEQKDEVHSNPSPNTLVYLGQRTLGDESDEETNPKMKSPIQNELNLALPSVTSGDPSTRMSNSGSGSGLQEIIPKMSSTPGVLKSVSSIDKLTGKLSSKPQAYSGKPNPGEEIGDETNTPINSPIHNSERSSQPSVLLSKQPNDSAVLKYEPENRPGGSSTFQHEKSIDMLKHASEVLSNNTIKPKAYSGQRILGEEDESEINQSMDPPSRNIEKSKLFPVTKDEPSTVSLVPKSESQSYPRETDQKVSSSSKTLTPEKSSEQNKKLLSDPSLKPYSNSDQHNSATVYLPQIAPEKPEVDEEEYQHALRTLQNINSGNFKLFSSEYFIHLIQRCNCASLKFLIPILQKPNSGILVTS